MKTPTKGDIVTPKMDIAGFQKNNQYLIINVESDLILVVNDFGYKVWRHNGYFHNITIVPLFARICNFVNKLFQI